MADSNVNILPLAALQNLVGRNNMIEEEEELAVKDSLNNISSLSNNGSITITKTKGLGGHFSNGASEGFVESEQINEKSFSYSILNNPSCTITRVNRSIDEDSDSQKSTKSGNHNSNGKNMDDNSNSFHSISELDKILNEDSPQQDREDSLSLESSSIHRDALSKGSPDADISPDQMIANSQDIQSLGDMKFSDINKKDILSSPDDDKCINDWPENALKSGDLSTNDSKMDCSEPTSSISASTLLDQESLSNIFDAPPNSLMETDELCEGSLQNDNDSPSTTKDSLLKNELCDDDEKRDSKDEENRNSEKIEASSLLSDCDSNGHTGVSGTSVVEEFKWDTVNCIFCETNIGQQEPKLLPCLHSSCGKCLIQEAREAANNKDEDIVEMYPLIYCPSCKKGFSQEAVIDNMFVSEVCEKESSTENNYCTSCSDEEASSGFCTDCCEWLCDACIQAHKRVKVTKDHVIKVKENVEMAAKSQSSRKNLFCSTHAKEQLNLYCVTCDQLTCRDCQLMEHRDHKYKFSVEMASQTKEKLKKLIRDIRKKRGYIDAAKDLVRERRQQLAKRQDTVKSEINRLIETFIDIIRQRGEVLIEQIAEVSVNKEEQLDKKTEVLNHLQKQANHCISVVESTLETSSELSLLYSKKILMDHVLKVDKDSPDVSLFDRFKAKLNSGDEISLRISNESRGLGKALKEVGYLLVDNRVYPPSSEANSSSAASQVPKCRSAQPSPVSESPSPRPSSQPPQVAMAMSPAVTNVSGKTTPSFSMTPPSMLTPQPPTLTPMHSHHQQQQMMQSTSSMHKFHNFGPCGTVNPPGLVRIQPKPQLPNVMNCGQPVMKPAHMGHPLGSFPRMPQLTAQQVRHADVSSVSSSTHPLGDSNHLRGLLGSGGSYKMGGYPQMMRMQQPTNQQFPPPQHSPQPPCPMQQQRMMDQNRRPGMLFDPMNSQLAMAAVGMAPPIMANTMPPNPMTHPRGPPMVQMMRGAMTQVVSMSNRDPSRQSSPHSTQPARHGSSSSPSWHTPHASHQPTDGVVSAAQNFDNSFKIMLGIASGAPPVAPANRASISSDVKVHEGVTSSISNMKLTKLKDTNYEVSTLPDDRTKSALSVLSSLVGGSSQDSPIGGADSSSRSQLVEKTFAAAAKPNDVSTGKNISSDPNDDWCAVCWDGGDLVCCDFCPKVFHNNCHIPSLSHLPKINDKWQCMICRDIAQLPDATTDEFSGKRKHTEPMTPKQLKIAQRILLELYCNYEPSQPFRELVDRELTEYYELIQHPMALEIIKKKLKPDSIDHYFCIGDFITDIKLIFANCYEFNPSDTEIYQNAKILEDFFDQLLEKWLSDFDLSDLEAGDDGAGQSAKRRKKHKEDIVHIS